MATISPGRTGSQAQRLGIAFVVFAFQTAWSQARQETPVAASFRFSVATNVGSACGAAFASSTVSRQVESRLLDAGIIVSNVHNAQLSADIDCVRVSGGTLVVHQCLALSEIVSASSRRSGATLAGTWRKCESFVCSGPRCARFLRSGLEGLTGDFLAEYENRTAAPAVARQATPAKPAVAVRPAPVRSYAPRFTSAQAVTAFYSLYILACMAVLLYWQFRSTFSAIMRA